MKNKSVPLFIRISILNKKILSRICRLPAQTTKSFVAIIRSFKADQKEEECSLRVQTVPWWKNLGRLTGAVGAVLLVSIPLLWLLTLQSSSLVWGKLIFGALCLLFYVVTNRDIFLRLKTSRSFTLSILTGLGVILLIGLVAAANYLAKANDYEIDCTREDIYSLSPLTLKVLKHLPCDIQIYAFYGAYDKGYMAVKENIERYVRSSDSVYLHMVNPQDHPELLKKYRINKHSERIVVQSKFKEARAADASEYELTNAIMRAADRRSKTIYFLEGHGEARIDDEKEESSYFQIAQAIRGEGYRVKTLSLQKYQSASNPILEPSRLSTPTMKSALSASGFQFPQDMAALIIAGFRSPLLRPEIESIRFYLERGGRVIVLLDPDSTSGLESLFFDWKIEVQNNFIYDINLVNRLMGLGPAAPRIYIPQDLKHPITQELTTAAVMFTVRSLKVVKGVPNIQVQPLVFTSEKAWGEVDRESTEIKQDEEDHPGPLMVGIVSTKHIPSHDPQRLSDEGRLVVFGDSDWINNAYLNKPGNLDLFMNTVNWMASVYEKISIGRSQRYQSQIALSVKQLRLLKFISLDIWPTCIIAFGLGIVLLRRQK